MRLFWAVLLSGCLGAPSVDEPARYDFSVDVRVNPSTPVAGKHLSFNLELSSHSTVPVQVDVLLRALRADGSVLHEQAWNGLRFRPEETWNLSQGFLTRTGERGAFTVVVEARDASGEVLWRENAASGAFR